MDVTEPEDPLDEEDSIRMLSRLLKESGARMCFCTLCNHSRDYGYCYACQCSNGRPEGPDRDVTKMEATIEHMRGLLKSCAEELRRK